MFYKGLKLCEITSSDVIDIYNIAKEVEEEELDKAKIYQARFYYYINLTKQIYYMLIDKNTIPFYYKLIPWFIRLRIIKPIMEKLDIYKDGVNIAIDKNPENELNKIAYILASKLKTIPKEIKTNVSIKELNPLIRNLMLEEINQDLRNIQSQHNASKYIEQLERNRLEYKDSTNNTQLTYNEKEDYELNKKLVGKANEFYLKN